VPCFPGSVEDLAQRTPDLRTPTWRQGHAHPKRVLIFTAPQVGFFPPGWRVPPSTPPPNATALRGMAITGDYTVAGGAGPFVVEDCVIEGTLHVQSGVVELARSAVKALVSDAAPAMGASVVANDCLFGSVKAAALAELIGVTVMGDLTAPRLWTSDSLYAGAVNVPVPAKDAPPIAADGTPLNCVRYSRVPTSALAAFKAFSSTDATPYFVSSTFGDGGCGVLLPLSGDALAEGAEDRGEVGAYHHRRYSLRARAVVDKLDDYLPLGQVPVIVPDSKLNCPPPTAKTS